MGSAKPPHTIYLNAQVLTLDARDNIAEAVAVRDGRIVTVGGQKELREAAGTETRIIDLGGAALLPGLYAPHLHFVGSGLSELFQVNLQSPPVGKLRNMDEVIEALRARARETPAGEWIRGRGYDDTLLAEMRHPNRKDLDQVSTEHPVMVWHITGHVTAANSLALEKAGVTKATPNPPGAVIRRCPETGEPDGVFEECGFVVAQHIPEYSQQQRADAISHFSECCVRMGVTTAVSAGEGNLNLDALRSAAAQGLLKQRVVPMFHSDAHDTFTSEKREALSAESGGMLHAGAAKLWHDGSIQAFTGHLSQPYFKQTGDDPEYRGYSTMTREQLTERVSKLHRDGWQVAVHGNGDAAIDDVLHAFEQAQKEHPRSDTRHRIEHCQMAREDQLERMAELGVSPSFFAAHVYYWGDRHRDIFIGPERAARISPMRSALNRKIRLTMHEDTPVAPVSPLLSVWTAVNRKTSSGKLLGGDQRLSTQEALRAMTVDAAWQNFEENEKGTIEPGKLADFTVLAENPLSVEPERLKDIKVLRTIVGGQTVYNAE